MQQVRSIIRFLWTFIIILQIALYTTCYLRDAFILSLSLVQLALLLSGDIFAVLCWWWLYGLVINRDEKMLKRAGYTAIAALLVGLLILANIGIYEQHYLM